MPKKRIPSSGSKASREVSRWLHQSMKMHQFVGVSLGGGKTDKTCVATVQYFPEQQKIFLQHVEQVVASKGKLSSDELLYQHLHSLESKSKSLAINAPLKLPKCMRCRLKCPGAEKCKESEIAWLRKSYGKRNSKKRPNKWFTPYTERCTEYFLANELEEKFYPPHALGSNVAPLTARAHYLQRRLRIKCLEVYPEVSLWRVGRSLGLQKTYLRTHRHSFKGQDARVAILQRLRDQDIAFFYEQDFRMMTENHGAFDAFMCGLTAVLQFKNQVEPRPKDFPKTEAWVEVPRIDIEW